MLNRKKRNKEKASGRVTKRIQRGDTTLVISFSEELMEALQFLSEFTGEELSEIMDSISSDVAGKVVPGEKEETRA